jgi:hypothetical protein
VVEGAGAPTQCSRYPALAAVLSAKRCTAESSTLRTTRDGRSLWRDSVRTHDERAIGITDLTGGMFAAYCPGIGATTVCSVSGQCLMIAQPYTGQSHGAGFVYEGDHTGGQIRTAADSLLPPWQLDAIMVTNHNMIRGCNSPFGESAF